MKKKYTLVTIEGVAGDYKTNGNEKVRVGDFVRLPSQKVFHIKSDNPVVIEEVPFEKVPWGKRIFNLIRIE